MEEQTKKIDMQVSGMHCATCALTVEKSLGSTPGVSSSSVNLATGKASVEYNPGVASFPDLVASVEKSGYSVVQNSIIVHIGGMMCASCVQTVSNALKSLPGVISADVNIGTEKAYIKYYPSLTEIKDIKKAITNTGYTYLGTDDEPDKLEEKAHQAELAQTLKKVVIGFLVSILLVGIMLIPSYDMFILSFVQFVIATPVLFWLAYPIFRAATGAIRNKTLNMDTMYAMGIGISYIASVLGTFSVVDDVNFMLYDTSLMLASFLMLGRYLESRAKARTSSAIKALMKLQSDEASVIREGIEMKLAIEDVVIGDIILMRAGERIPTDGIIRSGTGYADESMVTGEPLGVSKSVGDEVIGGTLFTSGSVQYEASRVGSDTMLARIIRLVDEAQGSRPPVERLADNVVKWFIPIILSIAIISSAIWYFIIGMNPGFSIQIFIAVIVVACPCALGLATPTAVTVGIGRGAELGILIRNGSVLEVANRINLALFDKTGTITTGKPAVTDFDTFIGNSSLLLSMAVSLENLSDHPLAKAIISKGESLNIKPVDVTEFESIPGMGLSGVVAGGVVHLGNREFLLSSGVPISETEDALITKRENEGKTSVLVSRDLQILGLISIADIIRPEAANCVSLLKEMGIRSGMVTGDNKITADAVAGLTGIESVFARVLPDGKEMEVSKIQKTGEIVAFIGDGINDAPALARSDTGIAIGSGTDVAVESADIVLVKDDLIRVPAAIQLARKVMGRIRLNLFWAFAYNVILIPLAAGIFYPVIVFRPEYGAFAMAFSSVTVVTLSLLLKSYTPPALKYALKQTEKNSEK